MKAGGIRAQAAAKLPSKQAANNPQSLPAELASSMQKYFQDTSATFNRFIKSLPQSAPKFGDRNVTPSAAKLAEQNGKNFNNVS